MIYKSISVKEVISKVYRDLDLQIDDRWMDMIEWAGEAIDHIGVYFQYEKRQANIPVKEYRGSLPCGFVKLVDIAYQGVPLNLLTGTFDHTLCDPNLKNTRLQTPTRYGFSINAGYLNFNFRDDPRGVDIAYLATAVDEEGFPLIPDNVSYKEAVYRYIVYKLHYPKFLGGTLSAAAYKDMENQWRMYCNQAGANAMMPDLRRMENIRRSFCSLIPHINKANSFFIDLNQPSSSRYNNF